LAYACGVLSKPYETIHQNFDKNLTELAISCQKILEIEKLTINITNSKFNSQSQIEHVRGLLLTFSKDLRVIMVLLASQMQTIRYITSEKIKGFEAIASNIQNIYSPLASRLGIWQIKWELEDLAFRVLEPNVYKNIAGLLEIKRVDREIEITEIKEHLDHIFISQKLHVKIHGRPKNIYSIVKKMRGKSLEFNQLYDLRAIRIITDEVADCYRCLSLVHQHLEPLDNQFDDYIAKPKSNGYQSLHTVVRDTNKRIFEINT
jgi:GTP pyrophosphokinase